MLPCVPMNIAMSHNHVISNLMGILCSKLRSPSSICGLHQLPLSFFIYLLDQVDVQGLKPSKLDPCLFVGKLTTLVIYKDSPWFISSLILWLSPCGIYILQEGNTEYFFDIIMICSTIILS